jgi:predicted peptidase
MKNIYLISSILFFMSFLKTQGQDESVFEKHIFFGKPGDTLNYRLMRPAGNDTLKKYPVVIFLHGSGERGNNNTDQLKNGALNFATESNRKNYPCYMIAPQCAKGYNWMDTDWKKTSHIQTPKPTVYLARVMLLLDSLINKLNIDTNRIYITGLSMGGFGVWDAISRWPYKFAAAVPVCGGGDTTKAELIKDIPIWAFHGANDIRVLTDNSRFMIENIRKAGGKPKYTEYPDTGHDSWVKAYAETEMFKWLFSQSKANKK